MLLARILDFCFVNMAAHSTFSYKYCLILSFIYLCANLVEVNGTEREMTINIEPGIEECFFEYLSTGQVLDVEYQVIDGGQGDLDVSFHLSTPTGHTIVSDYKKPENNHRHEATEDGDYRLCWDNTFSHFNSKTVFFEIIIESEDDDDNNDPWDADLGLTAEEVYEIKIQDIQDAINRVHGHLSKVRHIQDQLRAFEARDRNVAEGNFTRVNSWSMIQITLMLIVGFIQVLMVRSLFDDSSRVHHLWKKASFSS